MNRSDSKYVLALLWLIVGSLQANNGLITKVCLLMACLYAFVAVCLSVIDAWKVKP